MGEEASRERGGGHGWFYWAVGRKWLGFCAVDGGPSFAGSRSLLAPQLSPDPGPLLPILVQA